MLSTKQGDQQSRAELLAELLKETGFKPYLLRHGSGRNLYHLVVLRLDDAEIKALSAALDQPVTCIRVAALSVIALPLEPEARIGTVDARYYDAEKGRWTASIAFSRVP